MSTIFLISPANLSGLRGARLLSGSGTAQIHARLKDGSASLGEVFSYISGLYFRGKLAYANAFGSAIPGKPAAYVITPSAGLIAPDTTVTLPELRRICSTDVSAANARYCVPLEDDLRHLRDACTDFRFVLLGSIATPKYTEPLLRVLGGNLLYPSEFIGRGHMSRGALLLQCVKQQVELAYICAQSAPPHGGPALKRKMPGKNSIETVGTEAHPASPDRKNI